MCCFKVTLTRLYNHYQIPQFQSRTSVRLYARLGDSVTRCLKKILSSSIPQFLSSSYPQFLRSSSCSNSQTSYRDSRISQAIRRIISLRSKQIVLYLSHESLLR